MKKYLTLFFLFFGIIIFISGCGKKSLTDYVEVNFSGWNTLGEATYNVDTSRLYEDLIGFDAKSDFPNQKTQFRMDAIDNSYTIKIDKVSELKNDDIVKVNVIVNKDSKVKLKGGKKELKVKGLEEPEKLTSEELEKKLVVSFSGVSGRGEAKVDNLLEDPLGSIDFKIENDGELKNEDKAEILVNEELRTNLIKHGYVLDKKFKVFFDIKELKNVAENANDIVNLDDIKRMINEEVRKEHKNVSYETYEISNITFMYRQFSNDNDKNNSFSLFNTRTNHGNLIGVYSIKEDRLWSNGIIEYIYILGYSDIFLNDNNEANVAEIIKFSERKDETYSSESILKLYEGYGYSKLD